METIQKVIEYDIDPKRTCVGPVPEGKVIKTFTGKKAIFLANKLAQKLNDKTALTGPGDTIKGYFVKGDINVE